jgi:hypothetical protein
LLIAAIATLAGCGGHAHEETASDVAQRLAQTRSGHPASVTCHRASAKWWDCDVTYDTSGPNSLGTASEEIRVRAR